MTQPKNIALSPYGYVPRRTRRFWFGLYRAIAKVVILLLGICFLIISGCGNKASKPISTSSNTLIHAAYLIAQDSLK